VRPGHSILDIAGGTGDLTMQFADRVGADGEVVLADINQEMLEVGRDRLTDRGYGGRISYVQADAENLPFPDNHFNVVSIAFRTAQRHRQGPGPAEMTRVLKPGGKLLILEFSKPVNPLVSKAYDAYSFTALPIMGKLVAGDSESYRYLAESIRMHPDQETLKGHDGRGRAGPVPLPQHDGRRRGPALGGKALMSLRETLEQSLTAWPRPP